MRRCAVALLCGLGVSLSVPAVADTLGPAIDLTAFDETAAGPADLLADDLQEVSVTSGIPTLITPYVSGIVGASFGSLATSGPISAAAPGLSLDGAANQTMFTGGGAIGMAIARPAGQLRMEIEGRARGPITGQERFRFNGIPEPSLSGDLAATGGWSTTTNFWRDLDITDRFGGYLGGGFGVGGYQFSSVTTSDLGPSLVGTGTVTTFAWQVGTGVTYAMSDRVTLDLGYRFFAMTPAQVPYDLRYPGSSLAQPVGNLTSIFNASELLLSVRIYEPFRGLLR